MADIIDELLQSGSVDPSELASQLRRQKEYGLVGSLSGSSRLAPVASQMEKGAMAQAGQVGGVRREEGNLEAQRGLDQWKSLMAAEARRAEMRARMSEGEANRANARGMNDARIGAQRDIAKMRNKVAPAASPQDLMGQAQEFTHLADTAAKARKESGFMNTGFRSLAAGIGGPGADLQSRLLPLQSNEALQKLADLKAASKTGASGLGSVTEKEIDLLMANMVSLKQIQSEKQLDEAITVVENQYRALAKKLERAARGENLGEMPTGFNGSGGDDLDYDLMQPIDEGNGDGF